MCRDEPGVLKIAQRCREGEEADPGIGHVSRCLDQTGNHLSGREERSRKAGEDSLVLRLGEAGVSSAHDHLTAGAEAEARR